MHAYGMDYGETTTLLHTLCGLLVSVVWIGCQRLSASEGSGPSELHSENMFEIGQKVSLAVASLCGLLATHRSSVR